MLAREHPSAPLDAATRARLRLPNVEIVDPAATPLHDQLARSHVAVSLFSTTLNCPLSAAAPSKPSISKIPRTGALRRENFARPITYPSAPANEACASVVTTACAAPVER